MVPRYVEFQRSHVVPGSEAVVQQTSRLQDAFQSLYKRASAALDAERRRFLKTDPSVSWNFTLPGEEVVSPLTLMFSRAMNSEAERAMSNAAVETTSGDKGRALETSTYMVADLELVSRDWEESFMRFPMEDEEECSLGEMCYGFRLVEDNIRNVDQNARGGPLVRFRTPRTSVREDGLCVICLRAAISRLVYANLDSGVPQYRVIQPYRVSTDEYDVHVCFTRNSFTRFMGITDPFPMFFLNSFEWDAAGGYVQRNMYFRSVAVPSLRFLTEPLFLAWSEKEPRRATEEGDWVERSLNRARETGPHKTPTWGLRQFKAFWGIDTGTLFSFALSMDMRRQVSRFGSNHALDERGMSKSKWETSYALRLERAMSDERVCAQLKQIVRNSFARWKYTTTTPTMKNDEFFNFCKEQPRLVVSCIQEYASYVLEYQGFELHCRKFWRGFAKDIRERMDDVMLRQMETVPNYAFPRYKPWYWSFADYEPRTHEIYDFDARWLFTSESFFLEVLRGYVSSETVTYFARKSTHDDETNDEVDKVKNTLKVAFSVLAIRGPLHFQKVTPTRDVFLACPVCKELRTHVVDTTVVAKPKKMKRANKSTPVTKTLGAQKTSYDAVKQKFVCFTKKNCNFSTCVPIRFSGKYVQFFDDLMVQCPVCERVVRINPNDERQGLTEWHCGCVKKETVVECHTCERKHTNSRRFWKSVLAFGTDIGARELHFCKEDALPVWVANREAWYYPHLMQVLRA